MDSKAVIFTLVVLTAQQFFPAFGSDSEEAHGFKMDCSIHFTDEESMKNMVDECEKKTGFEMETWNKTQASVDDFKKEWEKKNYDDKCFMKCVYEGWGVLDKDGKIKPFSSLGEIYKASNATEALIKEFEAIYDDCGKIIDESFKDSKDCKRYIKHDLCVMEKTLGHKDRIEKACHQH